MVCSTSHRNQNLIPLFLRTTSSKLSSLYGCSKLWKIFSLSRIFYFGLKSFGNFLSNRYILSDKINSPVEGLLNLHFWLNKLNKWDYSFADDFFSTVFWPMASAIRLNFPGRLLIAKSNYWKFYWPPTMLKGRV